MGTTAATWVTDPCAKHNSIDCFHEKIGFHVPIRAATLRMQAVCCQLVLLSGHERAAFAMQLRYPP